MQVKIANFNAVSVTNRKNTDKLNRQTGRLTDRQAGQRKECLTIIID